MVQHTILIFDPNDLGWSSDNTPGDPFEGSFVFDAGNTSGISLVLDDLDGDPNLDDGGNQNGEIFDGNELLVSFGGDTSNAGLDVNSNDRFTVTGSDGSSFEGAWVAFGDGTPVSSISDI